MEKISQEQIKEYLTHLNTRHFQTLNLITLKNRVTQIKSYFQNFKDYDTGLLWAPECV